MARVILIGDVGGHPDHLRAALTGAGAYPRVPDGIDPKLGRTGAVSWSPLILDGEAFV